MEKRYKSNMALRMRFFLAGDSAIDGFIGSILRRPQVDEEYNVAKSQSSLAPGAM